MKKRNFKAYHANISFIDLLFNTVLGFAVFFIIAFCLISIQKTTKSNIETKAEFVATITWTPGSPDDIDLWVQDPEGHIIYFQSKEIGITHLDRDDLGDQNDTVITASGQVIKNQWNQEITTIRGLIPGEWIFNFHVYNKRTVEPTAVSFKIEKMNPSVTLVAKKDYTVYQKGEEITVLRMTIDSEGRILSTDEIPAALTKKRLTSSRGGYGYGPEYQGPEGGP